jgi:hypothetical protein
MHCRIKLLFATFVAAVVAGPLAAGSATASRSIEVRGGTSVTGSASRLTFGGTERSESRQIICNITLLRTIVARTPKTPGTSFGRVTGVQIDRGGAGTGRSPNCTHGSFIREIHDIQPLVRSGTPAVHREDGRGRLLWDVSGAPQPLWNLIYDSFQGTLPRIEGVNVHLQGWQVNIVLLGPFGETSECLYEGSVFGLIAITRETGVVTRATAATERIALNRISGGLACPARGTFEGTFTIAPTLTIALL